jgi:hypothetical protein
MLTRADVERITENVLSELTIEAKDGDFTSPNNRTIVLKFRDTTISTCYFDVVQQREYEG